MFECKGNCHCGNIQVTLQLSDTPQNYSPRTCDCDFCLKHAASYISDSNGSIVFEVNHKDQLGKYRQGSNSADFLFCKTCGILAGVVYEDGDQKFSAINSRILEPLKFKPEVFVSPKKLKADEKTNRWKQVWFSQVVIK